jgi:hypothetical protein
MNTNPFPVAVKKSPDAHHKFVIFLYFLADHLEGNPSFPNPVPSAAALKNAGDTLATANAKARHGGPAAVADRDQKRRDAEDLVDQYVIYVRATVKAQTTDPVVAATLILSSGLSIKKVARAPKAPLAAKHGRVSTEVDLTARAADRRATYFWEYSLDQKTWTSAPSTLQAKTTIAGLTPGQEYAFRFRVQTRKGMSDYSEVVKLIAI